MGVYYMYLMMMLATYISMLFEFNLSARPEFNRDIPKKRAMAAVEKFLDHHKAVSSVVLKVQSKESDHRDFRVLYILPNDLVYVNNDISMANNNKNINLYYDQHENTNSDELFLLRDLDNNMESNGDRSLGYLRLGKTLYNNKEMISKVVCIKNSMNCTGVEERDEEGKITKNAGCLVGDGLPKMCDIPKDGASGLVEGSCCNKLGSAGGSYLVSFKTIDARWMNRITGDISLDFLKAVENRPFNTNVGMIRWDEAKGHWYFTGKLRFAPAYEGEERKWKEEHFKQAFPSTKQNMLSWELPSGLFDRDFFKVDIDGEEIDYCKNGCLFTIRMLL